MIKKRQVQAFQRFLEQLPHGGDRELVILKGHLLIEEQVRLILSQNVCNQSALVQANLNCHQAICLAEALISKGENENFWSSVKKLNKLRNSIAHNIFQIGFHDMVDDFVYSFPAPWEGESIEQSFELSIWSLFIYISSFVEGALDEEMEIIAPDRR